MSEIGNAVLWIVNLFLIAMLLFSLAFGWKCGGKRMGMNAVRIILQLTAVIAVTLFLTKRYSWFGSESFYRYLSAQNYSGRAISPIEADKFRFYWSGVIWFLISLVGIELIISTAIRIYRKKHPAEKKPMSKRDHVIGEIAGGLLCMLWITLAAPLGVSLEKAEVFSNGSDLVNKTIAAIPVNYVAKPVTKLLFPNTAVSRVWDEGLGAINESVYDTDKWIEEHRDDPKVIVDLTGIFSK